MRRSAVIFSLALVSTSVILPSAHAVSSVEANELTLIIKDEDTSVRWHLQAGVNAVAEQNLFWDLAEITAPASGYDADTEWLEIYIKPGISFDHHLDHDNSFYGKL